jgi:hypothetical protein
MPRFQILRDRFWGDIIILSYKIHTSYKIYIMIILTLKVKMNNKSGTWKD